MRRNQRKPWPNTASHLYYEIRHLSRTITRYLLEIQTNDLVSEPTIKRFRQLLPIIRLKAMQIQNACYAYDADKKGRQARWASWATEEIDILAGAIVGAMNRVDKMLDEGKTDPRFVRRMVADALELAPLIEAQLNAGPAPQKKETPAIAQVENPGPSAWRAENHDS